MAVRSKRLFGPTGVGTNNALLYTCPAGETALIKSFRVANTAAIANTLTLKLNGTGGSQTIDVISVAGSSTARFDGWFLVMHPGDTLHGISATVSMIATAFGSELEGVAD